MLYLDKIPYLNFQNIISNDEYTNLHTLTVLETILIDEVMVFLLHLPGGFGMPCILDVLDGLLPSLN